MECFIGCTGELMRKDIKCSTEFEYESEDYYRCMEGPTAEYEECLRADGCIEADGTCLNRCEPILLDDVQACEDGLAAGELNQLDYAICMNKASVRKRIIEKLKHKIQLDFSLCWDRCTCEMPWCNCVPPSNEAWAPYDVVCYPDPEL
jgi:hypothetical protein